MTDEAPATVRPLESYLPYLRTVAGAQFPVRLRRHIDPSDVVQTAMEKARKHLLNHPGEPIRDVAAWLRHILKTVLIDALRSAAKRAGDVALEQSIGPAVEKSSARLERVLAGADTSPSEKAVRHEQLFRLAEALGRLPEDQRTAVEMKYLHDGSVEDIGRAMGRSKSAVGGLLKRGMRRLRELMQEGSSDAR